MNKYEALSQRVYIDRHHPYGLQADASLSPESGCAPTNIPANLSTDTSLEKSIAVDEDTEVITFLPYMDFRRSARCLDDLRLGKQRLEARQILNSIMGLHSGYRNHPAVLMWYGHADLLAQYYNEMVVEWICRFHVNTMPILAVPRAVMQEVKERTTYTHPPWLGMDDLHASHRAALLAKYPEHYSQFGWEEIPQVNYFWPVTVRPKVFAKLW